jgi:malate dehydrogenase
MRVAIVGGSGGVGASAALNILRSEGSFDVVLIGRRPAMVASHVMDLTQVCALTGRHTVTSGEMSDLASADIVIFTASPPAAPGELRDAALLENQKIAEGLIAELPEQWPGILIVVTNPVDALVAWIQRRTGLPRGRVMGYTVNDSLRLRSAVAAELGVHPTAVTAWVLGEHVNNLVMVWDRIEVDGAPVSLTQAQRDAVADSLHSHFQRYAALKSGRSSTWTSGAGLAAMISAIARDSGEVWPASVMLSGEYGHDGVALSVPVLLGRDGVREVLEWDLEPETQRELDRAAKVVSTTLDSLS